MTANPPGIPNTSPSLTEERRQQLRDSLAFGQIDARHATIKRAHGRTCKWLKTTDEYLDWLNPRKITEHHGFLWVKGHPGTGKSTLMKFAFNQAQRTMKDKVILSFFFNARGEELEQSTAGMYRSLLWQLLQRIAGLDAIFDTLPPTTWPQGSQTQWTVELLKELFEEAVQDLGKASVVCFIDALDECDEDQIRDMLTFFKHIGKLAIGSHIGFQVCFSSRHYPHISITYGLELVLDGLESHRQDIASYVDSELKIGHGKIEEDIRAQLQAKASGIFMWVVLVVDILNKEYDRGRIHALRKRLQEIPDGLDNLFRDILARDARDRDELILCIQWVLFAKRPLRPEELYFAVLAGTDHESLAPWDQELTTVQKFILDSSKGLAEITKSKTPRVQFIHESVQDFLLKGNGLREVWSGLGDQFQGQSHIQLKECCLKYICTEFTGTLDLSKQLPKASSKDAVGLQDLARKSLPFLEYAVRGVLYHADKAESQGIAQNGFLQSFPLQKWIYLHNLLETYEARYHTSDANLLHHAAEDGYLAVAKLLIEARANKDAEDNAGRTPLYWAAWNGHSDVVKLLIEAGAYKEIKDRDMWTPLNRAVRNGHSDVMKLLIEAGADKEARDRDGYTPLIWAAESGHLAVVKLLIEAGADKEARDSRDGYTPLIWAAESGHLAVVKLLIEAGADKEARDSRDGYTPLIRAAENGHLAVVKLLIEAGADKEARDSRDGYTPLIRAAENGHLAVVKLLIEAGADKEARDTYRCTPLIRAAGSGHLAVVKLLIEAGADKEARDSRDGYTPLIRAAGSGHLAVVKLLIEAGADKEARDTYRCTPLIRAAGSGHLAVVKLLIEAGADKEARDSRDGYTPLIRAARNGHLAVVKLLIEAGADKEARDTYRCTPLIRAAGSGHLAVVKLLIEAGADKEARDNDGCTPLSSATEFGHWAIVKLLTE